MGMDTTSLVIIAKQGRETNQLLAEILKVLRSMQTPEQRAMEGRR